MRVSGVFTLAAYGLMNGSRGVSSIAAVSLTNATFRCRSPALTGTRTIQLSSM